MDISKIFFVSIFFIISQNVWAEIYLDIEREKLIAEKLQERNLNGNPITLNMAKQDVFALYSEYSSDEKKGAVLLLHPMAAHPDWPGVIKYLREQLPQHGWSSFSIQLPLLPIEEPVEDYGKTFDDANKRINAAVKHLLSLDYKNIIIIGYGFGAITGLDSLKKNNPGIIGMIGIGLKPHPYLSPKFTLIKELAGFELPLLDVYGSEDNESVIETAADRRLAARKAENSFYKQIMIGGADEEFTNQRVILIKRMLVWMDEVIAKMSVSQDNDDSDKN